MTKLDKTRKQKADPAMILITVAVVSALFVMIILPASKLLGAGFSADGLASFKQALLNPVALFNSLLLGLLVGLLGTFIGFVTAFAQIRLRFKGKKILHWLFLLPVISPPFAVATAIITLFGKRGLVTYDLLGLDYNIYGLKGLVLVLTMTFAPIAYMNIRGMLTNLDPAIDEAAESLGCSGLQVLWKVTLPMVLPALLSSFLVLFVEGLADLANPLVLGGDFRVLASDIYFAVAGDGNIAQASSIALVLIIPALLVFVIQRYWISKKSVITVTGKPAGSPKPVTDPKVRIPFLIVTGLWALLIAACYLTLLIGGFTKILGVNEKFTWDHYRFVFSLGSDAIWKTVVMALIAAPLAALLSIGVAWVVVRYLKRTGAVLDFLGMLGSAIPGTVLGLGYALAFATPTWFLGKQVLPALAGGASVGAGAVAIVLVFIARGNPTGQQANIAALRQINPQIEEAATSLGASTFTVLRKVTIPLLIPAVMTAITFALTKSMTTITAIIFITTPQTKVMTSQILDEVDAGRLGNAFAYCTLLIVLVIIVLGIMTGLQKLITKKHTLRSMNS